MDQNFQQLTSKVNVATPEDYGTKRAQIQAARVVLEQIEVDNEAGRAKYEAELLRKVREGEEARQRLLDLQRMKRPLAIEAQASTSRIEEFQATSPQPPQGGPWITGSLPTQSSFRVDPPATLSATNPQHPLDNGLQQPPHHEQSQSYFAAPFRRSFLPQTQYQTAHRADWAQQALPPVYYHHMSNSQVQKPAVQYQPPFAKRQPNPSSQNPMQSQAQTTGVHGSSVVPQVPVNGVGNGYRNSHHSVHYKPTGVQPVGTSSLTGALGPPQSIQPSTPPSPSASTSSPAVPENGPQPPRVAQVSSSASDPHFQESGPTPLTKSELEDRKLRILTFRSSIFEWARTAIPNAYTQFFGIIVYKAPNSALYITSHTNGQEVVEEQNVFFERLWVLAGLPPNTNPFKQGSTSGPSALNSVTASNSISSTAPRTMPTPIPDQEGAGRQSSSASTSLPTPIPSQTSRQRTLVDPITGIWRSPADADKKRLARDVMYALGKRKQDLTSLSSPSEKPAKRQAFDVPSTSGGVHRISEPIISSIALPELPPEVTDKSVPVTASNGVQEPPNSVEPSARPIEPPQPTIVMPTAMPRSPSDSRPSNKTPDPSNLKESHFVSTPSISSVQNGDTDRAPGRPSGSLPSAKPAMTPTQTSSPIRATSPVSSLQQQPVTIIPATSVTQLSIAVPNTATASGKVIASSSLPEVDIQPSSSTMMVAADSESLPPANSLTSHPSSSSQVIRDEQVVSSSSKPIDDSAGIVRPSQFDLPKEASTSTAREPLFLPSPSSSPVPLQKNRRSSSVYVLVPPPPQYLIRHRKRLSRKDSTRTSSVASTSRTSRTLEVLSLPIDPHEQEAVQLACSRLQPLSCRWGECGTTLNSVDALVCHLDREHRSAGRSFICRWTQCGRQCKSSEKHREKHAKMTLQCAYRDCNESYRSSTQLLKHFRAKHPNGMLKEPAKPAPYKPPPPPPLPNTILPSYLLVRPPVTPASISPDEHLVLEPWVLRNVVGFDGDLPKRGKRPNGSGTTAEASNTYEFLNMRSTRYSWIRSKPVDMNFADLDSEEISKECDQGLGLFETGEENIPPSDSDEEGEPASPLLLSDVKVESHTDEEDTVEMLLIE